MRAERGQRAFDALFVADVREHRAEQRKPRAFGGRNGKPRLVEQAEQGERLERDGLSTRVRPGDDEDALAFQKTNVNRDGVAAQERMPRLKQQRRLSVAVEREHAAVLHAPAGGGKGRVKQRHRRERGTERGNQSAQVGGQFGEDFADRRLKPECLLRQLVVFAHDCFRLDEQRLPGLARLVHDAVDSVFVACPDGEQLAAGAVDGHGGFQHGGERGVARVRLERGGDLRLERRDCRADSAQFGKVFELPVPVDDAGDFCGGFVHPGDRDFGGERAEAGDVQGARGGAHGLTGFLGGAAEPGDGGQLLQFQRRAVCLRERQCRAHRLPGRERRGVRAVQDVRPCLAVGFEPPDFRRVGERLAPGERAPAFLAHAPCGGFVPYLIESKLGERRSVHG